MAKQLLLLNEFLPASALGLGWLTESLKTPTMDACPLQSTLPSEAILQVAGQDFESLASSTNADSMRLSLTKLLNNEGSFKSGKDTELAAIKINRYQLRSPRAFFKDFVQNEYARTWLNDCIQVGHKSYLVVELQTALNPKLSRSEDKERSFSADLTVPVSTIATGGADILGLGQQLDSSVSGSHSSTMHNKKSFTMEGEQIFAIGFKKIVWKSWGFKKDIDKARLDDNITWSILGEKRGSNDEEVIGADLVDDLAGKYKNNEDDRDGEDDEDEDEEDEESDLLNNTVEAGGQTFMIASEED